MLLGKENEIEVLNTFLIRARRERDRQTDRQTIFIPVHCVEHCSPIATSCIGPENIVKKPLTEISSTFGI